MALLLALAAFSAPAGAQDEPAEVPRFHKVREGESLRRIAKKYGCTDKELTAANRKKVGKDALIKPGSKLTIPATCAKADLAKAAATAGDGEDDKVGSCRDCRWSRKDADRQKLKAELEALGFKPPAGFRALIVKTTLNKSKSRILRHQLFDYGGDAFDHEGWNPASTVKLFSGVSAIERIRELGFSPKAQVTFHYKGGDRSFTVEDLFEEAVHLSKNLPHNRLVQLAGFDRLNGSRGTLRRAGLDFSYVMRAYEGAAWEEEGHSRKLNAAPRITLKEGRRTKTIPAASSKASYPCSSAACTSLADLAKMMCALMLHEQLPADHRLHLGSGKGQSEHLLFIRRKLNRKRIGKEDPVWDVLERHFIPKTDREEPKRGSYQLFRKAGFSEEWLSENMYIYLPRGRTRWLVSMAAHDGRDCLTKAADLISKLIKEEKL